LLHTIREFVVRVHVVQTTPIAQDAVTINNVYYHIKSGLLISHIMVLANMMLWTSF